MEKITRKEKILVSIVRTDIAVCILGAGVGCVFMGLSWQEWCPNNDAGVIVVLAIYTIALILLMCGAYWISPIFWKSLQPTFLRILFGRDAEIDWEEYTQELESLKENYIW